MEERHPLQPCTLYTRPMLHMGGGVGYHKLLSLWELAISQTEQIHIHLTAEHPAYGFDKGVRGDAGDSTVGVEELGGLLLGSSLHWQVT